MTTVQQKTKTRKMPFALRPMRLQDIRQATQIERDAFPSHFPPTAFAREVNNGLATYWVSWQPSYGNDPRARGPRWGGGDGHRNGSLVSRLLQGARTVWTGEYGREDHVVGFLGTWYMAGEAHVVSIAVRRENRGHGIGELLLIGAIEHALSRHASNMTLEVRASNMVARSLYMKYGFSHVGVRRCYYADDREDASIMSTDDLKASSFVQNFSILKNDHCQRWGRSERILG